MSEKHNVEWKSKWKDEYLAWICGFANAQGGMLVIGNNNEGKAVGLENSAKLMEDLPNKIRDAMGIIVDIILNCGQWKTCFKNTPPSRIVPVLPMFFILLDLLRLGGAG